MGHMCLNPYKQHLTCETQVYESTHSRFKKVRRSAAFKTQISTASCHRAGRHYRIHPERGGGALPGQDAGIPLRFIHGARVFLGGRQPARRRPFRLLRL